MKDHVILESNSMEIAGQLDEESIKECVDNAFDECVNLMHILQQIVEKWV